MGLLRPAPKAKFITEEDLERAEREKTPLCDEAHLQVFSIWYQFGGMRRPLTPVEAAEMPAGLAKDFVYLLKRMRELADSEMALGEFVQPGIYHDESPSEALYPGDRRNVPGTVMGDFFNGQRS
jgi:hypothetical protein